MATTQNTVSITKREYDFMNNRQSFLSRYGRHIANQTKPTDYYNFYNPTIAETNGSYTLSWECENIVEAGNLVSIAALTAVSVENGVAFADILDALTDTATITVKTTSGVTETRTAEIIWNETPAPAYNAESTEAQALTFTGTVTLPANVTNSNSVSTTVTLIVNVAAAA